MSEERHHRGPVQEVTATVELWSGLRSRGPSADGEQHDAPLLRAAAETLRVRVHLSALLEDGARVDSGGDDFGISAPRRGLSAIWHR